MKTVRVLSIILGVLLILVGVFGFMESTMAYGDIGIACGIGGAVGLLSGIGFIIMGIACMGSKKELILS